MPDRERFGSGKMFAVVPSTFDSQTLRANSVVIGLKNGFQCHSPSAKITQVDFSKFFLPLGKTESGV